MAPVCEALHHGSDWMAGAIEITNFNNCLNQASLLQKKNVVCDDSLWLVQGLGKATGGKVNRRVFHREQELAR